MLEPSCKQVAYSIHPINDIDTINMQIRMLIQGLGMNNMKRHFMNTQDYQQHETWNKVLQWPRVNY